MVSYKILKVNGNQECHKCGSEVSRTDSVDVMLYLDIDTPTGVTKAVGFVCAEGTGCRKDWEKLMHKVE